MFDGVLALAGVTQDNLAQLDDHRQSLPQHHMCHYRVVDLNCVASQNNSLNQIYLKPERHRKPMNLPHYFQNSLPTVDTAAYSTGKTCRAA